MLVKRARAIVVMGMPLGNQYHTMITVRLYPKIVGQQVGQEFQRILHTLRHAEEESRTTKPECFRGFASSHGFCVCECVCDHRR